MDWAHEDKFAKEGLTFDDVLLVPAESHVLPNDVSTVTRLTRTISLEIPIIFVTHDLAEAFALADRVAVLHKGKILQTGAPDDIRRAPASPLVADILGLSRD